MQGFAGAQLLLTASYTEHFLLTMCMDRASIAGESNGFDSLTKNSSIMDSWVEVSSSAPLVATSFRVS